MNWENWLLAMATILGTGITGLALKKPKAAIQITQAIGSVAISFAAVSFGATFGAFLARQAVLDKASSIYAADYAITDGTLARDAAEDAGRQIITSIANAIDPVMQNGLKFLAMSGGIMLFCMFIKVLADKSAEDDDALAKGKSNDAA